MVESNIKLSDKSFVLLTNDLIVSAPIDWAFRFNVKNEKSIKKIFFIVILYLIQRFEATRKAVLVSQKLDLKSK
jgi:hypothetical protein